MESKQFYKQVNGSKYMTMQFEFPSQCKIEDIRQLVGCEKMCPEYMDGLVNQHQLAYYATVVQRVELGIQGIKNKKDTPVEMNYGQFESTFLISVSFSADKSTIKLFSKMLADACLIVKLEQVFALIKKIDKKFKVKDDKSKITQSIRFCQRQMKLYMMSKYAEDMFSSNKDSFGYDSVTQVFNGQLKKIEVVDKDPLSMANINIDQSMYSKFSYGLDKFNPVLVSLMLSSLNGQQINFIVQAGKLWLKKEQLTEETKTSCMNFIKARLEFTNSKKLKQYSKLSKSLKAKMTQDEFTKKQVEIYTKKVFAMTQLFLQSASEVGKIIFESPINVSKFQIDKESKSVAQLESSFVDMLKENEMPDE